ncbi:hypothetical protein [Azospirillum sp. ST 5-10]|uniref:hypothetical protein n=1 Tax=unclassified Azospirillum TaxID=2630922 RepID=UPI003F49D4C8
MSMDDFQPPGDPRRPENQGTRPTPGEAAERVRHGDVGGRPRERALAWGATAVALGLLIVVLATML